MTLVLPCSPDFLALVRLQKDLCTLCLAHYRLVLQGDLRQAVEDYHKALGLRPEDTFTAEMLAIALQDEAVPEELEKDDVFG